MYWEFEPFAYEASGRARATLNVTDIHVVFSNHLDAGFNVRAWCDGDDGCISTNNSKSGKPCRPWTYWVVQENMDTFLPQAIATADSLRSSDTPFSYLTNAWLVAFLLDCERSGLADWRPPSVGAPLLRCPNASVITTFKAAVARRDVHLHAFPFSSNPGLYDTSLLNASLRMAIDQAAALGVRQPTTFSQRDETGMTRAIIPLLAAHGIGMISLGSGGSSGGHPVLPDLFVWRDEPSNTQLLFAHDHGYGGGVHILPNGVALYCAWNTDNGGPMKPTAVKNIYANLRKRYPHATVRASTFDDFYDAARADGVMEQLPVVTREIGDTWLYGDPSDPLKNVHFREMSRVRAACVRDGACDPASATMRRFDRLLTKIPEHTWGEDTTWYLGDNTNWTNAQFTAALPLPNYQLTVSSWLEQRSYLPNAIAVLDHSSKPAYTSLAHSMRTALRQLTPTAPTPAALLAAGYIQAHDPTATFVCDGVHIGFGPDGAVTTLARRHAWASTSSPLGQYTYQTLSADDFVAFDKDYGNGGCTPHSTDPGCHNFMKPNMIDAKPEHQEVTPTVQALWYLPADATATTISTATATTDHHHHHGHGQQPPPIHACAFATEASLPSTVHSSYGAPKAVWLRLAVGSRSLAANATSSFTVPPTAPSTSSFTASIDVHLVAKTPTRLAESSWVSFVPAVADAATGWKLNPFNTSSTIDPTDVVTHGATHLHSLGPDGAVAYTGREGRLTLTPLDTPIVSMGLLSPFPTPSDNSTIRDRLAGGVHANLQNNIWNTNYPQWYPFVAEDADARYRFELRVDES